MKVRDLIAILQTMPQDLYVEINDEGNGNVFPVVYAFHYQPSNISTDDLESVVLGVNVT